MIQALLLALLGVALGQLASAMSRAGTPASNVNNVRCGIFGALIGGLLLPRALSVATVAQYRVDFASLLMGVALATALLALLTLWRSRALERG